MKKLKYVVFVMLIVSVLASAVVVSAQGPGPQGQPGQGGPTQGQQPPQGQTGQPGQGQPGQGQTGLADWSGVVQTVSSASITVLRSNNETFTATISSTTKIQLMIGQTTGSISDIQAGSNVTVEGGKTSDTAIAASRIMVEPSGSRVTGSVSAISSATLTLTTPQSSVSVVTSSSTKFYKGTAAATLSDVTKGAMVVAYGTKQSDGSIAATYVLINTMSGQPGQGQPPQGQGTPVGTPVGTPQARPTPAGTPAAKSTQAPPPQGQPQSGNWAGVVQTVSSSSLTALRSDNQVFTATITSTTKIELMVSSSTGTVSDIQVGNNVNVEGQLGKNNTIAAARIMVEPSGSKLSGPVTAISDTTITMTNQKTSVTVTTSSSTVFLKGKDTASLSDVTTGAVITVYGTKQSDGSVSATYVLINSVPTGGQNPNPGTPPDQQSSANQNSNPFDQFAQWLWSWFQSR